MKTGIALIGFMGTGKTVVGKILAEELSKEFVELDWLIERKAGKTIADIFRQDGEIQFREAEIETVKEVSRKKNMVIACGGGIVLNKINTDRLRNECIIVYLTASPQIILRRTLGDNNERPLLLDTEQLPRIRELSRYRKPFYERAADIKVNTSRMKVGSVVREIIGKLKENESYH